MATFDYNVTAKDVKERTPVDTRPIPSTDTDGVIDDTDIEGWIDEGAAEMSGVLQESSIDGSDLSDEALQQIQTAIEHYAAAELLSAIGQTGNSYESIRSRYEELRTRYEQDKTRLDRDQSRVRSNVDTTSDKVPSTFGGVDYEL